MALHYRLTADFIAIPIQVVKPSYRIKLLAAMRMKRRKNSGTPSFFKVLYNSLVIFLTLRYNASVRVDMLLP